jgi:CRISPR-associated endoribonuclease Cas6
LQSILLRLLDLKRIYHPDNDMGDLIFKGDIESFQSLLAAGSVIGLGKKSAYGLGRYDIV